MEFGLYSANTQICNQTTIYLCHSPKLIITYQMLVILHTTSAISNRGSAEGFREHLPRVPRLIRKK